MSTTLPVNDDVLAASERIWQNSVTTGTDQITPAEIRAEIAAARAERKGHEAAA